MVKKSQKSNNYYLQQSLSPLLDIIIIATLSTSLPLLYRRVMTAPNVLRIGTTENIFVECQDCRDDADFRVKIKVMAHPTKNRELTSTYVTLTKKEHFQDLGKITVM